MNTGMPHPPGATPTTGKNEITDPNGSRLRQSASSSPAEDPFAFCERHISAMKRKADHNKHESLWFFYLVIGPSLAALLFVTLGSGWLWGKLIRSVLSPAAAAAVAWLQLRKPQQLWSIYRSAQRELEDQKSRFLYRIGAYADDLGPERLLAKNVADIAIDVHHRIPDYLPESMTENIRTRQHSTNHSLW